MDRTTAMFTNEKIDMLIARTLGKIMRILRLSKAEEPTAIETAALRKKSDTEEEEGEQMTVERVRFETLPITSDPHPLTFLPSLPSLTFPLSPSPPPV